MAIEWGYVCATSSRFEVLREGANDTLVFRMYVVNQPERFLMPIAALAKGSPFSGAHVPGKLHKRTRRMIARKKTA